MSFISLPLGDAKEKTAAPEGEYDIRIVKSSMEKTKKAPVRDMWVLLIELQGHGHEYFMLRENVVIPEPGDTEGAARTALRAKRMAVACGVPVEDHGLNPEDFQGAEGRVLIKKRENKETGNEENFIQWPSIKS